MAEMTKAQVKRRLTECITKLWKVLDSKYIVYGDIAAADARKVRDARNDLIKVVRKMK
jgi:hypothetical protein